MEIGPVILAIAGSFSGPSNESPVEYAMRQLMINSRGNTVILKEFAMEMLGIN